MTRKRAIVSVINDLSTDQRVNRTCTELVDMGYDVILVGRRKRDSIKLDQRIYETHRMKLLFESGVLFYIEFMKRLFLFLLFKRADLYVANDLDTLLPNYLISKLFRKPLIYDSHEIFCEVPELQTTPVKKKIWEWLEKRILPKLKYCITVNDSIANWFFNKYGVPFVSVRNIPISSESPVARTRSEMGLPETKPIVILQGAGINVQRGAEELVSAMRFLNDVVLVIVGGGDVIDSLKQMAKEFGLGERVLFFPKQSPANLFHYTANADIGITIDKDTNINYHFSLPNKVFDYIHAHIPVLATDLPEVAGLIRKYDIGEFISSHNPEEIANSIHQMLHSPRLSEWKKNTFKAAEENNWESERKKLREVLSLRV